MTQGDDYWHLMALRLLSKSHRHTGQIQVPTSYRTQLLCTKIRPKEFSARLGSLLYLDDRYGSILGHAAKPK